MEEEIMRLTGFWYEYVSLDHHKDRDCHFYINKVWSYGEKPEYSVEHYGYIADDLDAIYCETYEEAEKALVDMLVKIIQKEKEWAKPVIECPKDWDDSQMKKAILISSFNI